MECKVRRSFRQIVYNQGKGPDKLSIASLWPTKHLCSVFKSLSRNKNDTHVFWVMLLRANNTI